MDPNQALDDLRDIVRELTRKARPTATESEFVETFDGLDKWISNGGFLPKDWTRD